MSVNFDHHRKDRTGIPEVVLAGPKQREDFHETVLASLIHNDRILITRMKQYHVEILEGIEKPAIEILSDKYNRTAIITKSDKAIQSNSENLQETDLPRVVILAAGTSDMPIVEEIKMALTFFKIPFKSYIDIGVAGIHRHQEVIQQVEMNDELLAYIIVAGNEGALFSVVAGQTKLPVIAVPTSVGYGYGGEGETALKSALQSCSPGVVSVNIDNGFGAAAFVAKLHHVL